MNSLTELKKIIQSLNENITDEDIGAFQKQILQLELQQGKPPIVNSFLKMMRSLGKYLGSKKNNAHADSIPVLNSIVEKLDKITNNSNLEKDEINQILSKELQKYKSLQNKIASGSVFTDNELNDLKEAILAIDWEISEINLKNFEKIVTHLLSKSKNYKIQRAFLKIIHTAGLYIGILKADAPTDSISFLRSVFENLEKIVHTPDMALTDKKHLLETDIQRFYEIKQKFSNKKNQLYVRADNSDDDSIQPALSHIKQTGISALDDDIIPLITLPEQDDNLLPGNRPDPDPLAPPASTNKKISVAGPRNVMDDLFATKESPADELLDAIHLLDVNKSNPDHAMRMIEQTRDNQSNGIKNFTARKINTEPIPEIESRLDEFFSLDTPEDNEVTPNDQEDQTIELCTIEDNDPADGIVPFQYEDDSFEEYTHNADKNNPVNNEPDFKLLTRLKSVIENPEWLKDESAMMSIKQDLSYFESRWQTNLEKTCLVKIIASLVTLLKNQGESNEEIDQMKNEAKTNVSNKDSSDSLQKKTKGIWKKFKGMFTS
ncbi:hypothetical protein [Desulfobacula toluolica]|uniref:Conserved uncharacterized protein n=1 Tax=Desulfobacula toluolica (strain DSM 7467 / Tol2) TaxID=651182 RepID=K0NH65_DESTT|nr:hypothetical protein [Desulfobacula toluolica]CCK80566.1 conserved uncharacterized protein [Desulfobacula toluolica Tol2]